MGIVNQYKITMNIDSRPLIEGSEPKPTDSRRKCVILAIITGLSLVVIIGFGIWFFYDPLPQMKTAQKVDFEKFMGYWYEIAGNRDLDNLDYCNKKSQFQILDKTDLAMTTCMRNVGNSVGFCGSNYYKFDLVDASNSKIRLIKSKWLRQIGYLYIVDIDEAYNSALIVDPNKKVFSILSRAKTLDDKTYQNYLAKLKEVGITAIGVKVDQSCA
eukprot:TRINITY_DN5390_c0_g1_i6.p1 TRINITY_DN5390_c0_g1~~TRINITY_DN5390_c0_g1_i6.p1  ORF type:complete len:214 (+),score=41.08 TRINITY_DN5390_c0_g1_i6:143-784(+)